MQNKLKLVQIKVDQLAELYQLNETISLGLRIVELQKVIAELIRQEDEGG
ncbi:hypothetical protein GYN67_09050 [Lactococcus piscium]|nr:hypothetical protein [Lactococcus carnosus]MCJ1996836.1 hypothetical protein [Lactococcus carnosus]